ncbi:hypothetical protein GCM10023259_095740 [Thermocatellispora tengchongensis]
MATATTTASSVTSVRRPRFLMYAAPADAHAGSPGGPGTENGGGANAWA